MLLKGQRVERPGQGCGLVPQSFTLFPWLDVEGNIRFGLTFKPVTEAERQEIVAGLLEVIGLSGYRRFYPAALSGGMQQRVAIARMLATDPEVLLMDEPFGSLDTQTRGLMQERLLDIWERTHKAVLFVTHDIDEAIYLSDRVLVASALPASIKNQFRVPLPRPRPFDIRLSVEFTTIKKALVETIRDEALKAFL